MQLLVKSPGKFLCFIWNLDKKYILSCCVNVSKLSKKNFKNLSLIFANDANDGKFYLPISTLNDCQELEDNIDKFIAWSTINKLNINTEKFKALTISRKI